MVRYKPYEEQQLESLIPALNQGMDPNTAYSIFSGLQSGAVERAQQQKAMRQQMLMEAMGQLQGAAQAGTGQQGLEALLGSFQSAIPALNRPKLDARLEGTLESLIPQGMNQSPLYTQTPVTGEQGPLMPSQITSLQQEPESVMGIADEATALATGAESGTPVPLHEARMRIMAKLRAMGYPQSALNEAYDLIGQVYNSTIQSGQGQRATYLNAPLDTFARKTIAKNIGGTTRVGIQ